MTSALWMAQVLLNSGPLMPGGSIRSSWKMGDRGTQDYDMRPEANNFPTPFKESCFQHPDDNTDES